MGVIDYVSGGSGGGGSFVYTAPLGGGGLILAEVVVGGVGAVGNVVITDIDSGSFTPARYTIIDAGGYTAAAGRWNRRRFFLTGPYYRRARCGNGCRLRRHL